MSRSLLLTGFLLAASIAGAQDREAFSARLAPTPLDVEIQARITGLGSASAVLDGTHLIVTGTFAGMLSPATVAHLHTGPAMGIRGPVMLDLDVDQSAAGSFSGEWQLTRDQRQALLDGRVYLQIHSESVPDGNLWGWLLPEAR
jgi:hypothetical protein